MIQQNPQMNQPAGPRPEFRQCFKCNYESVSGSPNCPRCRSPKFLNGSNIRTRGFVLVGVGLFLVVFMGGIAVVVGMLILGASQDPANAKKLKNELSAIFFVAALFAGVIGFGLNAITGGAWMIIFGRRNRLLFWIMWALLAAIFIAGFMFRLVTD